MVESSSSVAATYPLNSMPASSIEFLVIQASRECGLNLNHVRDMIERYSQMHYANNYSEHS